METHGWRHRSSLRDDGAWEGNSSTLNTCMSIFPCRENVPKSKKWTYWHHGQGEKRKAEKLETPGAGANQTQPPAQRPSSMTAGQVCATGRGPREGGAAHTNAAGSSTGRESITHMEAGAEGWSVQTKQKKMEMTLTFLSVHARMKHMETELAFKTILNQSVRQWSKYADPLEAAQTQSHHSASAQWNRLVPRTRAACLSQELLCDGQFQGIPYNLHLCHLSLWYKKYRYLHHLF